MKRITLVAILLLAVGVLLVLAVQAQTGISEEGVRFADGSLQTTADPCATLDPSDEMIQVGGVCIDKYEASVWSQPDGGIQYGVSSDDYPCSANGQNCFGKIYARSVPNVQPSRFITWFQAQQALANSDKRLPTNAEWQMAVAGTPDDTGSGTTPCNTRSGVVAFTGASVGCVSHWGAFDMVGNLSEWVADWVPAATCADWGSFSDDRMCLSDPSEGAQGPGALRRGGTFFPDFNGGSDAGPFSVYGFSRPSSSESLMGFRGAR